MMLSRTLSLVLVIAVVVSGTNYESEKEDYDGIQDDAMCDETNCDFTTSECRYVVERKKGKPKHMCLDRKDIPKNAKANRCGTSGLPVLKLIQSKKKGSGGNEKPKKQKVTFKVLKSKRKCPSKDMVTYRGICCSDTEKPGQCPTFKLAKVASSKKLRRCRGDNKCPGKQKCCPVKGNMKTCMEPVQEAFIGACTHKFCAGGLTCKNADETTAVCKRERQGRCSGYEGSRKPGGVCYNQCQSDGDCDEYQKCCDLCPNCTACVVIDDASLCGSLKCPPGQECKMQQVECINEPCLPVASCVPKGSNPGVCPTAHPNDVVDCSQKCKSDRDCTPSRKCCSTGGCPVPVCVRPKRVTTCCNMHCPEGLVCREVVESRSKRVSVQCLEKAPESELDKLCVVGKPLLRLSYRYQRDVTIFSGSAEETGGFSCPKGFFVNVDANTRTAVCCLNKNPPCDPPCQAGEICNVDHSKCTVAPCEDTTTSCVADVCLLPKEEGDCSSIPGTPSTRFYYDSQRGKCVEFTYSGCEGNGNNFVNRSQCVKACACHICMLDKDPGRYAPTSTEMHVYYFDRRDEKGARCKPFIYKGNEGNFNCFRTLEGCNATCLPRLRCPKPSEVADLQRRYCRVVDYTLSNCPNGLWCCPPQPLGGMWSSG